MIRSNRNDIALMEMKTIGILYPGDMGSGQKYRIFVDLITDMPEAAVKIEQLFSLKNTPFINGLVLGLNHQPFHCLLSETKKLHEKNYFNGGHLNGHFLRCHSTCKK